MTHLFPKTDLARLVTLPVPGRALAVVAALRFVAVDDLRLAGVAPVEVNALVEDGLLFRLRLQRRLTHTEPTAVLALKRAGALELARALDAEPQTVPYSTKTTCERSAMFLDHALAVARFALWLARDLNGDGAPATLLSFETDPERLADAVHLMRDPAHLGRQPLVADALAVVQGSRGPEGLLVEIDRGTERPGYLGRKYAGYLAWWHEGGPERKFSVKALRLLTVTPDAKRTERLRQACQEATAGRAGGLFWFASEKDLVCEGMLAPVWSTTRNERVALWTT